MPTRISPMSLTAAKRQDVAGKPRPRMGMAAAERVNRISRSIRMADRYLRRHFPVLNHQNLIGFSIWLGSIAGMIGNDDARALEGLLRTYSSIRRDLYEHSR